MKQLFAATFLSCAIAAFAAAPSGAPAGSTGLCKDGTYWTSAEKKGACHGHKGVKEWYAEPVATAAASSAPAAPEPAHPSPAAKSTTKTAAPAPSATAAAGGGPGMVWVNESSKVYHCNGDKWYGKTKQGAYMSEADAKSKGYHPDHGKACS